MAIDRNAANSLRLRRNQQRSREGALTTSVTVAAPLSNTGTQIQLNLDSAGGLENNSGNLRVKTADTSLTRSASGLSVALRTNAGLNTSSGVGILLPSNSGLQTAAAGLSISLNATTPALSLTSGLTVLVASNQGLTKTASGIETVLNGASLEKGASGLRVIAFRTESSDPGSPANADTWYNSTAGISKNKLPIATTRLNGTIWTNTTDSNSVTNTTTETNFDQTFTLPANSLKAGMTLRFRIAGRYTAAAGSSVTMRVKFGSTEIINFGVQDPPDAASSRGWIMDAVMYIMTIGATGTLRYNAWEAFLNGASIMLHSNSDITIDTTASNVLTVSAQWDVASASNVILSKSASLIVG